MLFSLKRFISHPPYSRPYQPLPSSCIQQFRKRFARILSIPIAAFAFDTSDVRALQESSAIERWWNSPRVTGNWWGGRDFLEDHGVDIEGQINVIYYGVPTNDLMQNSIFCYNLALDTKFDFGKMLGLQGLSGQAGIQWETGEDINEAIGTGGAFSPTAFTGDWKWRLRPIVLTYSTPELFGIREFLTLSGGWQNPKDYFVVQPSANFFQNTAFAGGGGLIANGVLFDGSYVAWGGYAKVKPTDWSYVQGGLWAAVPNAVDWQNRGVFFQLARPPRRNGLFFMGETGVTPNFGDTSLPGKYAFGSYYWGLSNRSFFGATYPGRFGFYWQADQMLYREPTPTAISDTAHLSKDYKRASGKTTPHPSSSREDKLSSQGLYSFGFINYAPKFNNEMPLFFRTGLVYKGLIPTRDQDDLGIAFAFGNYSYYHILARRTKKHFIQRTNEAVLEVDYRVQINKWLYAQPFLEYLIRPDGNGLSKDALVLGIAANLKF